MSKHLGGARRALVQEYGVFFTPLPCLSRPQIPRVCSVLMGIPGPHSTRRSATELGCHTGRAEGPQNARVAAETGSLQSEVETDSEIGAEALL